MKLLIVSGLSGAGKTIALHSLEDMGTYCVDNLPVGLLPAFAEQAEQIAHDCVALGIDARTTALHDIPTLLQKLKRTQVPYQILFLEANEAVLTKRFSETRRKHPLTTGDVSLAEALQQERKLLEPLANCADIHIDTSQTDVHQLRDMIRIRVGLCSSNKFSLLFQSFGFKKGMISDADFVFDVRCLPNPYWEMGLRNLTGRDQPVINFLQAQAKVQQMREQLIGFLETWIPQFEANDRHYLTIAIGCTGGHHRSVYLTEQLAEHFSQYKYEILVRHREL
ncbi:ATPase, P-loop-containing [Candidatus Thiomargarita nelsonii]|uniref:ATPase, P-loop-containing n=1 Tax=Candidatus Thiomargarita nelsonii TaxID=1003181 RepID=A0A176RVA1_9GAMM|nr:ATPase, P-loop-containing [Candidatus Thiomargarita nelsonii]